MHCWTRYRLRAFILSISIRDRCINFHPFKPNIFSKLSYIQCWPSLAHFDSATFSQSWSTQIELCPPTTTIFKVGTETFSSNGFKSFEESKLGKPLSDHHDDHDERNREIVRILELVQQSSGWKTSKLIKARRYIHNLADTRSNSAARRVISRKKVNIIIRLSIIWKTRLVFVDNKIEFNKKLPVFLMCQTVIQQYPVSSFYSQRRLSTVVVVKVSEFILQIYRLSRCSV